MNTVAQDAFAMKELLEEGNVGLAGLARALVEACVNEMMWYRQDSCALPDSP